MQNVRFRVSPTGTYLLPTVLLCPLLVSSSRRSFLQHLYYLISGIFCALSFCLPTTNSSHNSASALITGISTSDLSNFFPVLIILNISVLFSPFLSSDSSSVSLSCQLIFSNSLHIPFTLSATRSTLPTTVSRKQAVEEQAVPGSASFLSSSLVHRKFSRNSQHDKKSSCSNRPMTAPHEDNTFTPYM